MANFKNGIKKPIEAVINNPTLKKLANNEVFTRIILPVGTTALSTSLAINRISNVKKQTRENAREYEELANKIDRLADKVDQNNKEKPRNSKLIYVFRKKRFSLLGGGLDKPTPKSIIIEGIKKIAIDSKYRSTSESNQSLVEVAREIGSSHISFDSYPEDTSRLTLYQLGDVLVIVFKYLSITEINKLDNIIESYCRTFRNTDYTSELATSSSPCYSFVELWIADDSLDYLIRRLLNNGFSINVIS